MPTLESAATLAAVVTSLRREFERGVHLYKEGIARDEGEGAAEACFTDAVELEARLAACVCEPQR